MGKINKQTGIGNNEYWEVNRAAVSLSGQACTLSVKHIRDSNLRLQFNREVAYFARGIVRDVEHGRKSAWEGLKALKDEHDLLIQQNVRVMSQSVGLLAGGFQLAGGVAICSASLGIACVGGAFMIAHGMNNLHENTVNLVKGRSDTVGATRMIYHKVYAKFGKEQPQADIGYGVVDISTSLYAAFRNTVKPGTLRLYRYIRTDYIRAHKNTSKYILVSDAISGAFTTKSIHDNLETKE